MLDGRRLWYRYHSSTVLWLCPAVAQIKFSGLWGTLGAFVLEPKSGSTLYSQVQPAGFAVLALTPSPLLIQEPSKMTHQPLLSHAAVREAVARIGDHNHCQAGGTIGLSGALAAALGQAVANATRAEQPSPAQDAAAQQNQATLARIRGEFLRLADADADAILEFVALEERGEALTGYALLCSGPREMADLAVEAARALELFRADVCERSRDDLEFALTLMAGVARAALQLLDSNLRIWPLPELLAEFDPHVARILAELAVLHPVERIRQP